MSENTLKNKASGQKDDSKDQNLRNNQTVPQKNMKSAIERLGSQLTEMKDDSRSAISVLANRLSVLEHENQVQKQAESSINSYNAPNRPTGNVPSVEELYQNFMDKRMCLIEDKIDNIPKEDKLDNQLNRIENRLTKIDDQVIYGHIIDEPEDRLSRLENRLMRMSSTIENSVEQSAHLFDAASDKLEKVYLSLDHKANELRPALESMVEFRGRLDDIQKNWKLEPNQEEQINQLRADILTLGGPLQEEASYLRDITHSLNALAEDIKTAKTEFNSRDIKSLNLVVESLTKKMEEQEAQPEGDNKAATNSEVIHQLIDDIADIKIVISELAPNRNEADNLEEIKSSLQKLEELYVRTGTSEDIDGSHAVELESQLPEIDNAQFASSNIENQLNSMQEAFDSINSRQDQTDMAISNLNKSVESTKQVAQSTQNFIENKLGNLTDQVQNILVQLKNAEGNLQTTKYKPDPIMQKAVAPLSSSIMPEVNTSKHEEKAEQASIKNKDYSIFSEAEKSDQPDNFEEVNNSTPSKNEHQSSQNLLGKEIMSEKKSTIDIEQENSVKIEGDDFYNTVLKPENIDLKTIGHFEDAAMQMGYPSTDEEHDFNSIGTTGLPIDDDNQYMNEINVAELLNDPNLASVAQLSPMTFSASDRAPALDPNREAKPHSADYNGIIAASEPQSLNNNPPITLSENVDIQPIIQEQQQKEEPSSFTDPLEKVFPNQPYETNETNINSFDIGQPQEFMIEQSDEEEIYVEASAAINPVSSAAHGEKIVRDSHAPISWDESQEEEHRPIEPGLGFNPTHLTQSPQPVESQQTLDTNREIAVGNAALLAKARQNLNKDNAPLKTTIAAEAQKNTRKSLMGVSLFTLALAAGFIFFQQNKSAENENIALSTDEETMLYTGSIPQDLKNESYNFPLPSMMGTQELPRAISLDEESETTQNLPEPAEYIDTVALDVGNSKDAIEPSLLGSITDSSKSWSEADIIKIQKKADKFISKQEDEEVSFTDIQDISDDLIAPNIKKLAQDKDQGALYYVAEKFKAKGDQQSAFKWMQRLADLGNATAQHRVGEHLEKGIGVEKDAASARDYYSLAEQQGHVNAMHDLGYLHFLGKGGEKNLLEANRLFIKAAELGLIDSQFNLAVMNRDAIGIPQNYVLAYKWFSHAALKGDKDAERLRKDLEAKMSAFDLKNASLLAKNWQPKEKNQSVNLPPKINVATSDMRLKQTTSSLTQDNGVVINDYQQQMLNEMKKGNVSANNTTSEPPVLVQTSNSFSHSVKRAQSMLNMLGFEAGTPDGFLGPNTVKAVQAFQKAYEIEATGSIDRILLEELKLRTEG